jgi:hypothetical protein
MSTRASCSACSSPDLEMVGDLVSYLSPPIESARVVIRLVDGTEYEVEFDPRPEPIVAELELRHDEIEDEPRGGWRVVRAGALRGSVTMSGVVLEAKRRSGRTSQGPQS